MNDTKSAAALHAPGRIPALEVIRRENSAHSTDAFARVIRARISAPGRHRAGR